MTDAAAFDIFLVAIPGLEDALCSEARQAGFSGARVVPGGVSFRGGWQDVWRANLMLRGCSRVLARIGSFRVPHLAQLDRRARKFAWGEVLRRDVAVRVEASCTRSRIFHSGAAAQRIARAIAEEFGAPVAEEAPVTVMARIADDLCTLSVDTSGGMLHKRGHRQAVGKAPMRETMAALLLRQCGFSGNEPVVDPMCGSGTLVIEAAEMAAGLAPGRSRAFAFEQLARFDQAAWQAMKAGLKPIVPVNRFFGSDRDAGAIRMSRANAQRAGVAGFTIFSQHAVSDLARPDGPPGLVIVNPPYGARIGDKGPLVALHDALGRVLRERFSGWRVGLVTTDAALARSTGLPFGPPGPPISHGGLKIRLWQTTALP